MLNPWRALVMLSMIACLAVDATPGPEAFSWGESIGGLQCGLVMLPPTLQNHFVAARLAIKNTGSGARSFYDDRLPILARALISTDKSGNKKHVIFQPLFGMGQSYNGTRSVTKLEPGKTLYLDFFSMQAYATDPYVLTFDDVRVDDLSQIPFGEARCGPIKY